MKGFLFAAMLGAATFASAAGAQTVNQRHADQQHRIIRGERDGTVTRGEASHLETQQASMHREERQMRYRHGGQLTDHDRMTLRHRENRASRKIHRARHNSADRRY